VKEINVVKRDGTKEPFDANKINTAILKACEGLPDQISKVVQVATELQLTLFDGITTEQLDEAVIQTVLQNVKDDPDYEKIVFTITTDGQVGPIEAFKNCLEAMYQQMSVFKGILDIDVSAPVASSSASGEFSKLLSSVEDLNLSARSFNCLDKAEIRFIGELALMDENELKELKNLGKKSLEEIKAVMEEIGYPVGVDVLKDSKEQLRKKITELKSQMSAKE